MDCGRVLFFDILGHIADHLPDMPYCRPCSGRLDHFPGLVLPERRNIRLVPLIRDAGVLGVGEYNFAPKFAPPSSAEKMLPVPCALAVISALAPAVRPFAALFVVPVMTFASFWPRPISMFTSDCSTPVCPMPSCKLLPAEALQVAEPIAVLLIGHSLAVVLERHRRVAEAGCSTTGRRPINSLGSLLERKIIPRGDSECTGSRRIASAPLSPQASAYIVLALCPSSCRGSIVGREVIGSVVRRCLKRAICPLLRRCLKKRRLHGGVGSACIISEDAHVRISYVVCFRYRDCSCRPSCSFSCRPFPFSNRRNPSCRFVQSPSVAKLGRSVTARPCATCRASSITRA